MVEKALEKLKTYSRIIHRAVVIFSIIEALFGIAVGYYVGNMKDDKGYNELYLTLFIISLVLYLILFGIRIVYTESFPVELAKEFKSARELEVCQTNATRQGKIGEYLINSIKNLNNGTCALEHKEDNLHLCDKGIEQGIKELISDLVDNIGYILNLDNNKSYTVGFTWDYYYKFLTFPTDGSKPEVGKDHRVFFLLDGLNKKDWIHKDILQHSSFCDESLLIHNILNKTKNNYNFIFEDYKFDNKNYSVISSPISEACDAKEQFAIGVFFIIANRFDALPPNIENTLKVFNWIISNWIYKYNGCVLNRGILKEED